MAKYKEQAMEDFSKPQRIYSDHEIQDFHNKIQKFWDEPREVNTVALGVAVKGNAQKFRHEDLHVAFGATRKVAHGKTFSYQYNSDRYGVFNNLWKQYEGWRQKQDWIGNKQAEELEKMANESDVPF